MATVTLGRIGYSWKGAYAGGTAYQPGDCVRYGGSAYVCKASTTGNIPTSTAYWALLVLGDNVADLSPSQGDMLLYDGSQFTLLGLGSAGQALIVNGAGNDFEFGSAGRYIKTHYFENGTRTTLNNSVNNKLTFTSSFTPIDPANNKLIVEMHIPTDHAGNDFSGAGVRIQNGTNTYDFQGLGIHRCDVEQNHTAHESFNFVISSGTIAAGTYNVYYRNYTQDSQPATLNPNGSDNSRINAGTTSTLIIREVTN
jgi:hypothetical protein